MNMIKALFGNAIFVASCIFLFSILSLFSALIAEYVYGMQPCILCMYQRYAFASTALLSFGALAVLFSPSGLKISSALVAICGLAFLAGGALAFHHVGVEQRWWVSIFEECAAPFDIAGSTDLMNLIEAAPAVRCEDIPWQDPILGISMAGYNAIISPIAGIISLVASVCIWKRAIPAQQS